jgi:outer membrane receptor protein involved in Fe transport
MNRRTAPKRVARWGRLTGLLLVPAVAPGLVPGLARAGQPEPGSGAAAPAAPEVSETGATVSALDTLSARSLDELSLEELLGTVVSVSRRAESLLKAPAAVSRLDRERIRHTGALSIADLLRAVPGVQVMRSAAGNTVVSLRGTAGLDGNNVVVLLDGMPLNSPLDGSVDWSALPVELDDLEAVEVVRGPVSTIYGASAYTGVISLSTDRQTARELEGRGRAAVGMDASGAPVGALGASAAGTSGVWRWRATANGRHDGLFSRSASGVQPALRRAGAAGTLEARLGEDATLGFSFGGAVGERSALDHLALSPEPQRNALAYGTARYELRNLPSLLDTLSVWGRVQSVRATAAAEAARGFTYAGAQSLMGQAGADLRLELAPGVHASVGGDAGLAQVAAPFLHPLESGRGRPSLGFYAGADADVLGALALSASARGDVAAVTGNLELSYRASAVYYQESWALRLSAGSAFRNPTYVEAGGRFVDPASGLILLEGNPGLVAPRISSAEAGLIWSPAPRVKVLPTLYVAQMRNLMVEDFSPLVRKSFRNDTHARSLAGGEADVQWELAEALTLSGSLGVLQFLGAEAAQSAATLGVPAHNSHLTAWLRAHGRQEAQRLGYGLGLGFISGRSYNVRAGIPPVLLEREVPAGARLEAQVDWQPGPALPLTVWLRGQANLPHGLVESPLPGAGALGTYALLGLEYRLE